MTHMINTLKVLGIILMLTTITNSGVLAKTSEKGFSLKVIIEGIQPDTLYFGKHKGYEATLDFKAARGEDGVYHFSVSESLPEGMYAIGFKRQIGARFEFYSCWVTDAEQDIQISTNARGFYKNAEIQGSEETRRLYDYLAQYETVGRSVTFALDQWRYIPNQLNLDKVIKAEASFLRFQQSFVAKHKPSLTADLIEKTYYVMPSEQELQSEGYSDRPLGRFEWQKKHYFRHFDPAAAEVLAQPLLMGKLDYYLLVMPPPDPDLIREMTDELLTRLEVNPELYQFYLAALIQRTENLNRHRSDELYIHLVQEYALKGKLTGFSEDQIRVWGLNAKRISKLTLGSRAPDMTLIKEDGSKVAIKDIEASWLLMIFWLPDCNHCDKELPKLIEFYETHKEANLKVLSVCGRSGSTAPICWTQARKKAMPETWITVNDPERLSRFPSLYNIKSYPHLILLDQDKKIRYNQAGSGPADGFAAILDSIIKGPSEGVK
jgi:thiol-disulfide isomerase/thioredoxin